MKFNLLATAFSTLLIASSTFVIPEGVLAKKTLISRKITTPSIIKSTVIDDDFVIKLSSSSLAIKDLEITLPQQMNYLEDISITDKSGEELKAEIQQNDDTLLITFSESIKPGNSLNVEFSDVDTESNMGETLLYKLSVQKEGLLQRIPIGTARFDVPDAS